MSNSSWVGSIDVNGYVKKLMEEAKDKIDEGTVKKLNLLSGTQNSLQTKISAFGQVKNFLDTFQKSLDKVKTAFTATYDAVSSNTSVATVKIDGDVTPGVHSLSITQMAKAQSVLSKNFTSLASPADDLTMTNTVTIAEGSNSFELKIAPGDSLQSIASRINIGAAGNDVGIKATVISTGTSYRLRIDSTETGVANAATITETGVGTNALDIATSVPANVLTEAKNAVFAFDGINFDVPTNSNTISGLNITLASETGSSTISVSGTNQVTKAATAIQDVVNAYNEIIKYITRVKATSDAYDPVTGVKTKSAATDPNFSIIQNTLKELMTNSQDLADLGIVPMPWNEVENITVTQADGSTGTATPVGLLKVGKNLVTSEGLTEKLTANFADIQAKLTGENGIFTKLNNKLTTSTGEIWKIISSPTEGALTAANNSLAKVNEQITEIKKHGEKQKDDLLMKYGKLALLLGQMQVQGQYMSQQMASWANNK